MSFHLSHVLKLEFQTHHGIILTQGIGKSGREYFAYIKVNRNGIEEIARAHGTNNRLDLNKVGEVLIAGFGEPPESVRQQMEAKYNFTHYDEAA